MATGRFRDDDVPLFLRMAAAEGWISDRWEIDYLLRSFPEGCLVHRPRELPVAFVTATCHRRSGWIGNLLVHPAHRRRGIGWQLMQEAILALELAGVETVWLTASPAGRPLYERLGFREIDRVDRWLGEGFTVILPAEHQRLTERHREVDATGWGDHRAGLLTSLECEGVTIVSENSFLVTRAVDDLRQIGPWGGETAAATALFAKRVRAGTGGETVCLDVPQGNGAMGSFLERQGLQRIGTTLLMYRGAPPVWRPELIGACASMGSMG